MRLGSRCRIRLWYLQWTDNPVGIVDRAHNLVHVGNFSNLKGRGELKKIQAGAADKNFHPLILKLSQRVQGTGLPGHQSHYSVVVKQNF